MKFQTLSVASSLAIMAAMAAPAIAQDEDEGARTNTIVVTAEFREANLQDTPIAITAVNAEMLEARGQTDISQVANQAPNVSLTPQPQNGGTGLIAFIRGVGQVDFNYALDPGVGVYVDDVFIPTLSSSLLELMDLDRVEVLRGPQGTLAGKNSIGGSIKLFSAKPTGSGEGYLRATYGSYDRIEMRGMADFEITDNLFARVSGFGRNVDGYVTQLDYGLTHPGSNVPSNNARGRGNPDNTTMGGSGTTAGRIALRWIPTDRLEVNLSADYTSTQGEAGPTVLIAAGAPTGPATFDPTSDNPATSVGAGVPGFELYQMDDDGNLVLDDDGQQILTGFSQYTSLPWLTGLDGNAVPVNCAFVAAGPYSCDTLSGDYGDPGFIAYSNFLDARQPTSQAPFKPYAALQNQDFSGWGVHSNVTFDATDNLQLVWISSWREYESKWGQDQDATPVPVAQLDNQLNHRAWSQEIRANFEIADGLIEGTVGGFWLDQNGEYTARVDLNYAGIDFIHGPDTTPSTTKAAFTTITLRPTDMFSITGGLRYTKDKKTYTYFRSNPDGTAPFDVNADGEFDIFPPACEFFTGLDTDGGGPVSLGNTPNCLLVGLFNVPGEFQDDRFDWRIAADYRFSDALLMYASVSTGFKGGGVNPRPFFGPSAGSCDPAEGYVGGPCNQIKGFNPETITTYEVGFKADLLDRRLRLNGAAFFNKYEDIILQLSACPASPCLQPNNVGSADVKGLELEFSAYPVDGLSLDGGVSYLDFQYTDVGASGLVGDEITPYTPEWTYSFGIQYDADIEAGSIMARFDGSYQSETYTDSFNTFWSRIDSRFLGNARLGFTTNDEAWNVALEVRNVFDKYYFSSVSDVTGSLGLVTGVPGLPRTWQVSVGRRF